MDGQHSSPLFPSLFIFSTEHTGPYLQAQLYWAGQLWGRWPIKQVSYVEKEAF
jgi:hypothetical protein